MSSDRKPYLLLAIVSATRPYISPSADGGNVPILGPVPVGRNANVRQSHRSTRLTIFTDLYQAISTKMRLRLAMLYVSAQIIFALCEQLEYLEMRAGGARSVELLASSRL